MKIPVKRWLTVGGCIALCAAVLLLVWRAWPSLPLWTGDWELSDLKNDSLWGMVLIDIQSEETAAFYHVEQLGVYVLEADEAQGAYQAGVRSGDRLVALNGQTVGNTPDLTQMQTLLDAEEPVKLTLERGNREITVCVAGV